MNTKRLASTTTMVAAGLLIGTAASGQTNAADTSDLDAFMAEYRCHHISNGDWSPGADLLAKRGGVKTTLFVIPGEQTVMIRKGSNKAETAAASAYGSIRMVCAKRVSWSEKPELGS